MNSKIILATFLFVVLFCSAIAAGAQTLTEPQRQALIAQIQAQIDQLTQQAQQMLAQQQGATSSWCHDFNTNLGYNESGASEVGQLHIALTKEGISYSPDAINTYSEATMRAVQQFQAKYSIYPQSGWTGPLTREKLNQLYGCSAITPGQTTTACVPNWVCTSWSDCSNSTHTRTCADYNYCGVLTNMPATRESCTDIIYYDYNEDTDTSTTTDTDNTNNICKATCTTQNGKTWAIDCYNNPTLCDADETCNLTYYTTYSYVNGVIKENKELTGSECVALPSTGTSADTNTNTNVNTNTNTTCAPNWVTGSWTVCANNQQTRTVTDSNNCGTDEGKPDTTQACGPTVTLKANNSAGTVIVPAGQSLVLSWTSTGAVSCEPQYGSTGQPARVSGWYPGKILSSAGTTTIARKNITNVSYETPTQFIIKCVDSAGNSSTSQVAVKTPPLVGISMHAPYLPVVVSSADETKETTVHLLSSPQTIELGSQLYFSNIDSSLKSSSCAISSLVAGLLNLDGNYYAKSVTVVAGQSLSFKVTCRNLAGESSTTLKLNFTKP